MRESCFVPVALIVSMVLFFSAPADAQGPSVPCCGIVSVDLNSGIVTAKVTATGNVFQFKPNGFSRVDSYRATLENLKPGQAVYANFTNHQISLDGHTVCCTMATGPQPNQLPDAAHFSPIDGARFSPIDGARPSDPCCAVFTVNAETGVVTVKVNGTRNVFQFKPNSFSPIDGYRATLAGLKPGQAVYANFANGQVSFDGRTACCKMTSQPHPLQPPDGIHAPDR